jgi:glycosyltransferase involved in cell wall biosynthesis
LRLLVADIDGRYHLGSPAAGPFGGMGSALCYLSRALAAAGHEVDVLTQADRTGPEGGPGERLTGLDLRRADHRDRVRAGGYALALCLSARPEPLRGLLGPTTPLALWTGHADDQAAVADLALAEVRDGWDRFLFVSDWQRDRFGARFGVPRDRSGLLRNAIGPAFEGLFADPDDLARAKAADPPVLAYTSTPFRGLDLLLAGWPLLGRPARLRVFSSMAVYGGGDLDDPYRGLYEACANLPGVVHEGSLLQADLAPALRGAHVLAYPNTFEETSCISAMEAMAAGLLVVTAARAALPETTAGFADLVAPDPDLRAFALAFYRALAGALDRLREPETLELLWAQVEHANRRCTWAVRAGELAAWVEGGMRG